MTLQLCASPCAHAAEGVVRGSPDPALSPTEGLSNGGMQNDHDDSRRADNLPSAEPTDQPDDDGDWEEFDPAPLEKWILDDFDWEIEESYPERGDYWDDSLDGQWALSRWGGIVSSHRVVLVNDARQSLADSGFPGGAWEPEC